MAPARNTSRTKPKPSTLDFGSRLGGGASKTKPLSQVSVSVGVDKGKNKQVASVTAGDDRLWVERYRPDTRDELAVHKNKVEEVARWLTEAYSESSQGKFKKYRRILTLTGPSGAGKTATICVLAKALDIQLVEWKNSIDDIHGGADSAISDRESLISKFNNFFNRASAYGALEFTSASSSASSPSNKRLILLEDLPNILHTATRDAFHTALEQFVLAPTGTSCPLVIIVSDAGTRGESGGDNGASWRNRVNDAIDVRMILPKHLQNSPYVADITFNPIAITYLRRAVQSLFSKHFASLASSSGRNRPPSQDFVDSVLENSNGDIRSALMTLQFATVVDLPSTRKNGEKAKRTMAILESMTQREHSLQLFHLLGKILYNKRYGDDPVDKAEEGPMPPAPRLPNHLMEYYRRPSKADPNLLYADSPVDTSLMTLYVHQNYTQFCDEIEHARGVCEWLAMSDLYSSNDMPGLTSEYAFYVMSAGTIHSLPSPVPRRNQKTVKPEWFEGVRKTRIAEGQVEDIGNRLRTRAVGHLSRSAIGTEMGKILQLGWMPDLGQGWESGHDAFSNLLFDSRSTASHQGGSSVLDPVTPDEEKDALEMTPRSEPAEPGAMPMGVVSGWIREDEIEEY